MDLILGAGSVSTERSAPSTDELSVAEVGVLEQRHGSLLIYPPGAIGRPWHEIVAPKDRPRRRLRRQLAGSVRRGPRLRPTRGTGLALVAVVIAAAFLSRASSGVVGSVYPAGAAGALLGASDLGDTWSEGGLTFDLGAIPTAAYDPNSFAHGSCGRTAADPTSDSVAARTATFNNGNRFVSDTIGVFPSAAVAHERYASYRSALDECHRWTATTSDGGQLSLRLDELHGRNLADESGAYRLDGVVTPAKSGLPQSTAVQAAVVVMRRLNTVSVVAEMSMGYLGQNADARTSDATLAASVADAKLSRLPTVRGPLQGAPPSSVAVDTNDLSGAKVAVPSAGQRIGSPQVLSSNEGGRVAATVLQVLDPATGQDGYDPKPGYRFVGVQIRLGNVGQTVYDDSPENGALLVDDRGAQHYADLAEITAGDGFGGHVRLSAEDARTGYIVFQLPTDARPHLFQFALDSGFAQNMAQWALDAPAPHTSKR